MDQVTFKRLYTFQTFVFDCLQDLVQVSNAQLCLQQL